MRAVKSPADQPCAEQPRGRFQGEAHVFFKICHYWLKVSFGRFLASSNSVSSIFSCIHLSWEGSWDHSCLLKELDSMGTSARLPSHLIFLGSVHFFSVFSRCYPKRKDVKGMKTLECAWSFGMNKIRRISCRAKFSTERGDAVLGRRVSCPGASLLPKDSELWTCRTVPQVPALYLCFLQVATCLPPAVTTAKLMSLLWLVFFWMLLLSTQYQRHP